MEPHRERPRARTPTPTTTGARCFLVGLVRRRFGAARVELLIFVRGLCERMSVQGLGVTERKLRPDSRQS